MNILRYRNTLIAAAVAASLGIGATACSKAPEPSASEARSSNASEMQPGNTMGATKTARDSEMQPDKTMAKMKAAGDNALDAVSDTWITSKVKSSLLADDDAKGLDVSVETRDGVVILGGALKDQQAIDHVRDIAAGVKGVNSVDTNAMTVTGRG